MGIRKVVNATSNDTYVLDADIPIVKIPRPPDVSWLSKAEHSYDYLQDNGKADYTWRMATFNSTLTEKGFVDGQEYYVELTAYNGAGPPLNRTSKSTSVLVDFTPPVIGTIFNT